MQLVSGQSGWLLSANRLFWTDTQGLDWKEITPKAESGATLAGSYFQASGNGWVFSVSSAQTRVSVASTSDKGAHWSYSSLSSPFGEATPFGGQAYPFFLDAQNGWVMFRLQSGSAFRPGVLFHTSDGGATWTQCPEPPAGGEISFSDALHGVMGPGPAGDELYSTADGGQSWQKVDLPVPAQFGNASSTIQLPHFTNSLDGSLLRTFSTGTGNTALLYRTTDGGATWTAPSSLFTNARATSAALTGNGNPASQIQPLAVGSSASVLKSSLATEALPVRISFSNETTGWVLFSAGACNSAGSCTQSHVLMGTRDGGATYFSLGAISGIALESTVSISKTSAVSEALANSSSYLSASPQSSATLAGAMGFDACTLPTTAQMQTWATSSPYKVIGTYIGGVDYACKSSLTNYTASWASTVLGQGWELIPIWVGLQAPNGTTSTVRMSTDPATAYTQGVTEANSAIAAMAALGFNQGSPILYDMEAYTYSNTTYRAATQSFLQGWTTQLHTQGYISGVYSSHPEFKYWYPTLISPIPDIIWYGYFFSSGVACGATCQTVYPTNTSFDISTSYWTNDHRMRQTSSGFNSTYGGLTLNIDEDWVDAAMVTATPNTLTAARSGSGTGTIASTQIASTTHSDVATYTLISCGTSCSANFAPTDVLTLKATPTGNAIFSSWTGCDSVSSNLCTVTVSASKTVTAAFTELIAATPTFSPAAGTYTLPQTVTISTTTPSAVIYYTTDGTTPTTASAVYSAPVLVAATETLQAIASASGYDPSSVASAKYSIVPATLAFTTSPSALTIVLGQSGASTITITPSGLYSGTLSFTCTGLPSFASCSFSPSTVTYSASSATQATTVTVSTNANYAQAGNRRPSIAWALLFPFLLAPLAFGRKARNFRLLLLVLLAAGGMGLIGLTGCTHANSTPLFNNSITINVTSSSTTTPMQQTLMLTIARK
ncbi:MAG: DUF1906 domain-containing protein [Terracidiphilus sp.]|nr:DUF1906 domain-containing protein [Terracidiphilus sp.]